jgi:hypothetical protein
LGRVGCLARNASIPAFQGILDHDREIPDEGARPDDAGVRSGLCDLGSGTISLVWDNGNDGDSEVQFLNGRNMVEARF